MAEQSAKINATIRAGRLNDSEIFWRILQPWLLERGYQLRDRFSPDWTPSWLKQRKSVIACPDGLRLVEYDGYCMQASNSFLIAWSGN